jgi:Protein of unknown function (DUF6044)
MGTLGPTARAQASGRSRGPGPAFLELADQDALPARRPGRRLLRDLWALDLAADRVCTGFGPAGRPTYRQFFAQEQFARIAAFIGRPQSSYRVMSLGMYPSVPLYNGFHCLDGYEPDHSLEYHRAFRQIIAPELERSQQACDAHDPRAGDPAPFNCRMYFDTWGGRCYLPASELPAADRYCQTREKGGEIDRLEIDRTSFRDWGGMYILSAVRILQAEECGLRLLEVFDGPPHQTAWRIHLYEVLP